METCMPLPRNGLQDEIKPKKTYGHPSPFQYCSDPFVVPHHKPSKHDYPKVFLCFESPKGADDKKKDEKPQKIKKRTKSRELIASILHTGCECERRNGLQDDCPRTECRGSPACMTVPPTCGPSEFSMGKHMAKHYEKSQKERKEFIKRFEEKEAEKEKEKEREKERAKKEQHGHHDKVGYSCIPLDQIIHKHEHHCPCEHHEHPGHHRHDSHHDYHCPCAHHDHHEHHGHHEHHDHHEQVRFICAQVDQMIHNGMQCPICDRPLHGHNDKKHNTPKPIVLKIPIKYICPEAS